MAKVLTEEEKEARRIDGLRYRQRRESLGLSRGNLAEILGLSRHGVELREKGKRRITMEHWLAIDAVAIRVTFAKSDKQITLPRHKVLAKDYSN